MKRIAWGMIALLSVQILAAAEGTSEPPRKAEAPAAADVAPLLRSGRQFLTEGKWVEAAALFEKVRSLDPANQEGAFGLSAAYIETGRMEDALPLLEKLAKDVPDNPMVKNNLAWVYIKVTNSAARNPEKAVLLARDAVLVVPADYSVWNTLAEAYYACGKYDRAVRAAESAVRLVTLAGVTNAAAYSETLTRCKRAAGMPAETEKNAEP